MNNIKATCCYCKESETVPYNTNKFLKYQKQVYHVECFKRRILEQLQDGVIERSEYDELTSNIHKYINAAVKRASRICARNQFKDMLMKDYNFSQVPLGFWTMLENLERGTYKGDTVKPIPMIRFYDLWQFSKPAIAEASKRNLKNGTPVIGEARLYYDVGIVLKEYPRYMRHLTMRMEQERPTNNVIDFSKLPKTRLKPRRNLTEWLKE